MEGKNLFYPHERFYLLLYRCIEETSKQLTSIVLLYYSVLIDSKLKVR
jgi:hypothetical protein